MNNKPLNNRYQPIRLLGSGGFGETLLAEDTHMPSGRLCVIKQLKPIDSDSQTKLLIQQRFQREATILEKLSASNRQIPQLYAYFCEAGEFFLVEELIQGKTIAELVQQTEPLPDNAVKQLLIKILQVLERVHSEGIIHRDLKPENIILRSCDCQPVLIDFGAVKETMKGLSSSGTPEVSIAIGTSGFMSPEQAAGRPVFASDLYSLGVTAIYMLTGKVPQELGLNPHTGAIEWQQFAPSTSPNLVAIIEHSTQSSAGDRYNSAAEMLAALDSTNLTCQFTVTVSPSGRQLNSTTVLSNSREQSNGKPARRWRWFKAAIACGFLLGVPVALLSNVARLELPISSKSQSAPDTVPSRSVTNSSSAATRQENLQKLLATKKCRRCDLSGVNLTRANLSGADLKGADLSSAVLSSANLFQAELQSSNLEKAKLDGANLYGIRLNEADLGGVDLSGANLSRAYLSNTNLGNANLVNANLDSARLSSTNLTGADLSHASLQNASLKRANLFKAQLTGANLTGAEFCSSGNSACANLTSANLAGAVGVKFKD